MHGLMLVAFFAASLVTFSVLNAGTWTQLSDSNTERLAARMLIEHACNRWDPPYSSSKAGCPGEFEPSNLYTFREGSSHRCSYTRQPYDERSAFFSVLASRTDHSYFCLGRKKDGRFVKAPSVYASNVGCEGIQSLNQSLYSLAPEGGVVLCERTK